MRGGEFELGGGPLCSRPAFGSCDTGDGNDAAEAVADPKRGSAGERQRFLPAGQPAFHCVVRVVRWPSSPACAPGRNQSTHTSQRLQSKAVRPLEEAHR